MLTKSRKTKRIAMMTLTTLLAVGVAATALGQGPGGKRGGRGGAGDGEAGPQMRIERMQARLDLSDEQVAAISAVQEKGRAANLELRKELMRLRNEQRGEMLKDEPSADTVVKLTRKIGELRTEMQVKRTENRLAVRKLLTPEQRDKMLMGKGGEGRGGRDGRGAGRGQGDCGDCGRDGRHGGHGRGGR